jgi:SAM-dependent methyltransferase
LDQVEIPDGAKDVDDAMRKIRASIEKGPEDETYIAGGQRSNISVDGPGCHERDLSGEINRIRMGGHLRNDEYVIKSHRPVIGRVLSASRSLINGEVRRYVDPILINQTNLNTCTGNVLANFNARIEDITRKMDIMDAQVSSMMEISAGLRERVLKDMDSLLDEKALELLNKMNGEIESRAWLASIISNRPANSSPAQESPAVEGANLNYFLYSEKFRGSRDLIKQRQEGFVKHFQGCKRVLDIGCGRGEFLELLRDNGITAIGVDIDEDMAGYCRSKGLSVELSGGVEYLESLDDKSLDGIFLDQVVEHLEPAYLMKLLSTGYKKLNYGYNIVVETVNPLSLTSFINFYIDMTHKKPVHPDTLSFLLSSFGFRDIEVQFFAPVRESLKLKRIDESRCKDEDLRRVIEENNKNVDILNSILFGPQDYLVIGKK